MMKHFFFVLFYLIFGVQSIPLTQQQPIACQSKPVSKALNKLQQSPCNNKALDFCIAYLHRTPTVKTVRIFRTVTLTTSTSYILATVSTVTLDTTVTTSTSIDLTTATPLTTTTEVVTTTTYTDHVVPPIASLKKRSVATLSMLPCIRRYQPEIISEACSCILPSQEPVTLTKTIQKTQYVVATSPKPITATSYSQITAFTTKTSTLAAEPSTVTEPATKTITVCAPATTAFNEGFVNNNWDSWSVYAEQPDYVSYYITGEGFASSYSFEVKCNALSQGIDTFPVVHLSREITINYFSHWQANTAFKFNDQSVSTSDGFAFALWDSVGQKVPLSLGNDVVNGQMVGGTTNFNVITQTWNNLKPGTYKFEVQILCQAGSGVMNVDDILFYELDHCPAV